MKVNLEELPDVGLIHVAAAIADVHVVRLNVSRSDEEGNETLVDVSFGSDRHGPTRFKKALEYVSELPPRIEYEHYRAHMFGKNTPDSGPPRLSVAGERPSAHEDGDIVYSYQKGRTKWTPHQRGGATRCRIVCWDYAYSAMALCSFSDRFCYETGRDIAFERALEQVRVAYANDREEYNAQVEEERQRRKRGVAYNVGDVHTGVDPARDEPSERKSVMFAVDEDGSAYPHETFDEGISDDEVIESIRKAAKKVEQAWNRTAFLEPDSLAETESQYRELFNEYLMATGMHPAEEEYVRNNPHIPDWLSDYVKLIANKYPARSLNYWPWVRGELAQKIEDLVRENVDVLGVDDIPAGRLWLDLAYELLQGLVERKKAFIRERP